MKKSEKGIILIEAILALGMIVIIMTALVTALVSSLSNTSFSRNQSLATNYAQEGLEIARNDKDTDFTLLKSKAGVNCIGDDAQSIITDSTGDSCSKNVDGLFTRKVYININGNDQNGEQKCIAKATNQPIFVASTVSWADSKCSGTTQCHKVELNSCFVNLNAL